MWGADRNVSLNWMWESSLSCSRTKAPDWPLSVSACVSLRHHFRLKCPLYQNLNYWPDQQNEKQCFFSLILYLKHPKCTTDARVSMLTTVQTRHSHPSILFYLYGNFISKCTEEFANDFKKFFMLKFIISHLRLISHTTHDAVAEAR